MNNDIITLSSSAQARTDAQTLLNDAVYYGDLCTELRDAKTQIQANWEGNSADINDIITRIDSVTAEFSNKIIGILDALATEIIYLADETDRVSQHTVEEGAASGDSDGAGSGSADGEAAATTETKAEKKGFWKTIGDDFKDDWDYSDTDGVISAIGNTAEGILNTAGSIVNTVGRCLGGLVGWILD